MRKCEVPDLFPCRSPGFLCCHRRGLWRRPCGFPMEDTRLVEPEGVDTDNPVPARCLILLLVINQPEFPLPIPRDTPMPRPKDATPLSDDRISGILRKRT